MENTSLAWILGGLLAVAGGISTICTAGNWIIRLAERARVHFGAPAHNVSCLRCKTWNAQSGDELLAFFLRQPEVRYAYKINSTNVHFDIPKGAR